MKAASKKSSLRANREVYERQARICKAFANPTRLHLLDLVGKADRTATELQEELGITKANLSQHLAVLKGAAVVTTRRDGKTLICSLAIPEVKQACSLIRDVLRAQIEDERRLLI